MKQFLKYILQNLVIIVYIKIIKTASVLKSDVTTLVPGLRYHNKKFESYVKITTKVQEA